MIATCEESAEAAAGSAAAPVVASAAPRAIALPRRRIDRVSGSLGIVLDNSSRAIELRHRRGEGGGGRRWPNAAGASLAEPDGDRATSDLGAVRITPGELDDAAGGELLGDLKI